MPIEPKPYWLNVYLGLCGPPGRGVSAARYVSLNRHHTAEAAAAGAGIGGVAPLYRIKVTPLTPEQRQAREAAKAWRKAHPAIAQAWAVAAQAVTS